MSSKSSSAKTIMVEMVFPNQTNHYGTLFGGQALELMDKCAFVAASRYTRKPMVTACSERVDFRAPAKNGSIVELIGRILKHGKTSVTVGVQLIAEDLLSGNRHLCAQGSFVLVAVDSANKPVAIHSCHNEACDQQSEKKTQEIDLQKSAPRSKLTTGITDNTCDALENHTAGR